MLLAQVDHALNWAGQLGALAGTLFLFTVSLAWAIYKIAAWYMLRIAEPESQKRINLIDQLAASVVTITSSIKTIVDNTTATAVAIGRMEEKIEDNHRATMEHVDIAKKFEQLRLNLPTKSDITEIVNGIVNGKGR